MSCETLENSVSMSLAVVVLNYKTPALVEDCLRSLDGQIEPMTQEVVVVDNCSGDDSADVIEAAIEEHGWSGWARVVRSPVNGGFAAGNNVGIQASDAQVYLLLNSDTIVRDGAIAMLMQTLDGDDELDMLGPGLEWADGVGQISTFRYRTPITEMLYSSRLGVLGRMFPRHEVARELDSFAADLDWVSFACVAIRRRVFEEVGYLDEGYFMYFEDMAFCRKAKGAGFRIGYQPDVHVVHLRGGSSPVKERTKQRKRRPGYYYAARSHYLRSFYGRSGWVMANVLWCVGWVLGMLRGRTGAVEHEFFDIWTAPRHTMVEGGAS